MNHYNNRFIKLIRTTLHLTKQEMSNVLGIPRNRFAGYENGWLQPDDFFYERMIDLYGIDMRQPDHLHKIVFTDPGKISAAAYRYLSELELPPDEPQ